MQVQLQALAVGGGSYPTDVSDEEWAFVALNAEPLSARGPPPAN